MKEANMRKLIVFNQVSLDGYFADENNDMSWAHQKSDPEWDDFSASNASGGGELLFGRVTYELMASFWPTPQARKQAPQVADGMNNLPKVVFSKTLTSVTWQNTTLVKDDLAGEVRKLKQGAGKDLVIMGSGSIVTQLTNEGLIDEYQLVVQPIILGKGKTLFAGVSDKLALKRTHVRSFKNGNMVLCYQPA
jgi:dihydrofolate reductase